MDLESLPYFLSVCQSTGYCESPKKDGKGEPHQLPPKQAGAQNQINQWRREGEPEAPSNTGAARRRTEPSPITPESAAISDRYPPTSSWG